MERYHEVGLQRMISEIKRLGEPSSHTIAKLDATLASQFSDTQQRVHVLTGRLKASGFSHSHMMDEAWEGRISYGDGLTYAEVSLGNRNGDFMAGIHGFEGQYRLAIDDHFEGNS